MYGRWWLYYVVVQSRQAAQAQSSGHTDKHEVAFDRADDCWIFARLALVLAVFFAGLACILWVAS